MAKTLHQYRAAFSRCHDGAYRQMGLRYIRDAIMLQNRNDEHVAELTARLPMLLAMAQERTLRQDTDLTAEEIAIADGIDAEADRSRA
jgi:hypothetical protein